MGPRISIVIPAYNEETRIERTLRALLSYLGSRDDVEILVVMDGCTDRTPELVAKFAEKDHRVIPLVFERRLGKGGALLRGFKSARGDIIVMCDADMPTTPDEVMRLASMIGDYDLVVGSRYVNGTKLVRRPSLVRFLLSRAFNVLVRVMFRGLRNFKDTQCGLKAMKRTLFKVIKDSLMISGFAFDVNLIYSALRANAKVKEVGVYWRHVEEGSKLSHEVLKTILKMMFSLLKLKAYYLGLKFINFKG